jgi:hypothetical protein
MRDASESIDVSLADLEQEREKARVTHAATSQQSTLRPGMDAPGSIVSRNRFSISIHEHIPLGDKGCVDEMERKQGYCIY